MLMSQLCLFLFLQWLLQAHANTNSTSGSFMVSKPGCQLRCGSLTVPYPFGVGIGAGCSIGLKYDINCSVMFDPPKAFMGTSNLEILAISDSEVRIANQVASVCYDPLGGLLNETTLGFELDGWPFTFSDTANKFTVIGCDDMALVEGLGSRNFSGGCVTMCSKKEDVPAGICDGDGCCQISIPKGLKSFISELHGVLYHIPVWSFDPCSYAFLGDHNSFHGRGALDFLDVNFTKNIRYNEPMVLDWVIGNQTCSQARNSNSFLCLQNTYCNDSDSGHGGYRCGCKDGFVGNL